MGKRKYAKHYRRNSRSRSRSPTPLRSTRQRRRSRQSSSDSSSLGNGNSRSPSRSRSRGRPRDSFKLRLKAFKYVVGGEKRRLRRLLRRNIGALDLAAADSQRRTLLHHACTSGREGVVALLLRRGAPAWAVDASGDTPAHLAARAGLLTALAELLRAPGAPPLDTPGADGATLRELMVRALGGGPQQGAAAAAAAAAPQDAEALGAGGTSAGGDDDDEEAQWQRRLREEYSDAEDGGQEDDWGGGGGGRGDGGDMGAAGLGETDDEWASRLWREMQRRRFAAAAASAAAFSTDLRAEAARRAAEAAERSQRILQEEKAKDAEWRRRTVMALEAGPATPPLDIPTTRASYDARWAALDAASAAAATSAPLLYDDIPWPLEPPPPLLPPQPLGPAPSSAARGEDQASAHRRRKVAVALPPPLPPPPSVDSLRDFLLWGARGPSDVKRRLRGELLRWHPDKFLARFGGRLEAAGPAQRQAAAARVQQVAQVLTQVLAAPGGAGGTR